MSTVSQAFKDRLSDEFLNKKKHTADPLADAAIEQIISDEGKKGAMELFNTLIREIELPLAKLPLAIQEFAKKTSALPAWADTEQLKIAERFFIDHGPKFMIFLYYKSLPTLYACGDSSGILVQTGRLAHKEGSKAIFSRRVAETGQFLMEVMAPNGLRNNGPGIGFTQKVRLIHASIRKFIPVSAWDRTKLGQPINQEELAATLMTFSISLIDGLELFNIHEIAERQEAYLHAWKVVGHILGIDADLLPSNVAEGRYLLKRALDRNIKASENGVILTNALIAFGKEIVPFKRAKIAPEALIRFLNEDRIANAVGVSQPAGCLANILPIALATFLGLGEKIEDKLTEKAEPLHLIIDSLSMKMIEKMVDYFDTYKDRKFHVPTSLKNAWSLEKLTENNP